MEKYDAKLVQSTNLLDKPKYILFYYVFIINFRMT